MPRFLRMRDVNLPRSPQADVAGAGRVRSLVARCLTLSDGPQLRLTSSKRQLQLAARRTPAQKTDSDGVDVAVFHTACVVLVE